MMRACICLDKTEEVVTVKKLRLAIIGQGRSGKKIHGAYYKSEANKYYEVAYVVDRDEGSRDKALSDYEGCQVLSSYDELLGKNDIDIVVNASYSNEHYPITLDLLSHGFNVLVEKPFSASKDECERLIKTAREHNCTLAVFQQTNLAPFFIFTKELMQSGKLGEIKQINIRYNGFSRRWDWQTLQKRVAGSLYNTGPHPIGIALSLLDFDPEMQLVFSSLDTALTSGDAEDYAKMIFKAPKRPVVDLEISAIDAFTDYNIKLQGSKGTYKCTPSKYEMKYIVDGENPERPVIEDTLRDANGEPVYCSEKLITHQESGSFTGTAFDVGTSAFYEDLYFALTEGAPLHFPPKEVARIIGFIEKAHADNQLAVKY